MAISWRKKADTKLMAKALVNLHNNTNINENNSSLDKSSETPNSKE